MSYKCTICGKGPVQGGSYSHSNRKTNRTFKPNLQKQKVVLEGKTQTAYVCTKCIKSGFTAKPAK
ncbi:MAG: 50S ribosomal protein L28 [Elusimicrobium sp.]|jgi:large subunit ribosomal protein L28|nr:50S ribosomal protein L28 [Elusimicrobium sp.]